MLSRHKALLYSMYIDVNNEHNRALLVVTQDIYLLFFFNKKESNVMRLRFSNARGYSITSGD